MISTRGLIKICGYGTFGMVGIVLILHNEVQTRIRKSVCYTEAFKYLHENEKVVDYFGQPIKAGYANNYTESDDQPDTVLWYKVPLKGPKGNGTLLYKAIKDEKWLLSKVEVELEKLPGKRFLIIDNVEKSRV